MTSVNFKRIKLFDMNWSLYNENVTLKSLGLIDRNFHGHVKTMDLSCMNMVVFANIQTSALWKKDQRKNNSKQKVSQVYG